MNLDSIGNENCSYKVSIKKKVSKFYLVGCCRMKRESETGGTGLINCVEASKIGLVRDTGVIDW